MVRSEQQGLARRQNAPERRDRVPAGRGGLWALAIVASLIAVVIVSATGCSSDSQTSASTSSTAVATAQTGPSGSMPAGFQGGTPPSGRAGSEHLLLREHHYHHDRDIRCLDDDH